MIEIKRWDGRVLYTAKDASDVREAVEEANLSGANLYGANLNGASGINNYIKCIQVETYPITYTATQMQIGCERHEISDWKEFSDERILRMDGKDALKFWRKYKDWIFATIDLCPATPTKGSVEVAA